MTTVTGHVESYYRTLISRLGTGNRLPSERAVATELNTCRSTVRLVLVKLKAEGLIQAIHGRGYFTTG